MNGFFNSSKINKRIDRLELLLFKNGGNSSGGGDLQSSTDLGNITNNAIQITGINNYTPNTEGLLLYAAPSFQGALVYNNGTEDKGFLSFFEDNIQLQYKGTTGGDIGFQIGPEETPSNSGTNFTTRVSGLDPILNKDFVTLDYFNDNATSGPAIETGTWTPVLTDSGDGIYDLYIGYADYYVIGDLVHMNMFITISSVTGTPGGTYSISAPFPAVKRTFGSGRLSFASQTYYSTNISITEAGEIRIALQKELDGNVSEYTTNLSPGDDLLISITYVRQS